MRVSKDQRSEVERVLALSMKLAPVFVAISGLSAGVYFSSEMLVASGSLFLAGIVSFCGLLLSWRHYRYGVSLSIWLVFATCSYSVPMAILVLPSVRIGALHPLAALCAMVGWFGLGAMGPIFLLRSRLRRWLLT